MSIPRLRHSPEAIEIAERKEERRKRCNQNKAESVRRDADGTYLIPLPDIDIEVTPPGTVVHVLRVVDPAELEEALRNNPDCKSTVDAADRASTPREAKQLFIQAVRRYATGNRLPYLVSKPAKLQK